jgi:hypothetical protein
MAIVGVGAGTYAPPAVVPARRRLSLLADLSLTLVRIACLKDVSPATSSSVLAPWTGPTGAVSDRCPAKLDEKVVDAMMNVKGQRGRKSKSKSKSKRV